MLKHYVSVTLRSLKKHLGYTLINVFGLSLGLACCLLIGLFVQDELSYDRFHANAERIYRIVAERGEGDDTHRTANTSYPIIPHLRADFPEIEAATRLRRTFQPVVSAGERRFREERFFVADSTFFEVFSFPLVRGDARTALDTPDALLITEETARRYFGTEDPIGQTVTYQTGSTPVDFIVTGVLRDLPHNSHAHFDFLGRIDHLGGPFERWQTFVQNYSYVRLPDGASAAGLEAKLPDFVERYVSAELEPSEVFELSLQPLTDIHLHSDYQSEVEPNGRIALVYLFAAIAVLILLVACANFVNLTTAQAAARAREVGVRKAVGAHRLQLAGQFLAESMALSMLALGIGLLLVATALPAINEMSGRAITPDWMGSGLVLPLVGGALIVGIIAGTYPAFYLSAVQPTSALRGRFASGRRGVLARRGLVVFQFVVCISLIACTAVVYQQMRYTSERDLGFDKNQVVVVPVDGRTVDRAETIIRSLEAHPGVVTASMSMSVPSTDVFTYSLRRMDRAEGITTGFNKVDHGFIGTYGLRLQAGRAFDPARSSDSTSAFVVNEEAVRRLSYPSPEAIIGETLEYGGGSRTGTVIGVVQDFNAESLHEQIQPIVFFIEPDYYYLSARLRADDTPATLAFIHDQLSTLVPHLPFEYSFVDERFEALYRGEQTLGRMFTVFAFLAVLIACLGLLGLAAFATQRRTREVGIRKVLGASTAEVVVLLSKEFAWLVLGAFVVATPVAYLVMRRWLDGFAYRVEIGPGVFLGVGAVAFAVALLTVSYHAVRAATADPVETLRYE